MSPKQIVPRLADRGEYIASESTFYRVLRAENQLAHRGKARAPSARPRPDIEASAPNQVYSWDITYLRTTVRGAYYYLYLVVDVYSRRIVGWQVHDEESAELAAELMKRIVSEAGHPRGLKLHSDNGSPMKGSTLIATLQKLGVIPSFSRPRVSDDPSPRRSFAPSSTAPASPRGPSPPWRPRASGWWPSLPGTTANIGTAESSSLLRTSATSAARPIFSNTVDASTSALGTVTPNDGPAAFGIGHRRARCASASRFANGRSESGANTIHATSTLTPTGRKEWTAGLPSYVLTHCNQCHQAVPIVTKDHQRPAGSRFRRDSIWMLAGNIAAAAAQWLVIVLLAKQTTPATLGLFAFAQALAAPVVMATNLDLRSLIATDSTRTYPDSVYLAVRRKSATVAFIVIALLGYFSQATAEGRLATLVIGAAKCVDALTDTNLGFLQRSHRHDLIARTLLLRGTATALLVYVASLAYPNILTVGAAMMLASLLACGYVAWAMSTLQASFAAQTDSTKALQWRLLLVALPAGGTMLLISLQTNIPRFFLESHVSLEALGIFAALTYPWAAGSLVVQSLGQAAAPRYGTLLAQGRSVEFRNQLSKLLLLGSGLGISGVALAYLAGAPLLSILYTPEYGEYETLLVALGGAAGIGYVSAFLRHALIALRVLRGILVATLASTATLLVASFWMISSFGLMGAAAATILSATMQLLGFAMCARHALRRMPR